MSNRLAAVLGVLLSVAGCRTVEPPPPPDAPKVTSFTASKARIAAGEEVTLTFTTTKATKVEVSDDSGREVVLSGTAESGTAKVAPTRSSFYVLRATGEGGRDTAFLQIAVNEPLKDLFLIAVPASINSGDEAQLLWGAPGASSVTLKTGAGTPAPLTGTTGSVTVKPATTEQYTLTAQGVPGTAPLTALARVQVRPVLKTATLNTSEGVLPGKTLRFAWTTAGAERVSISERTFGQLSTVTDAASVTQGGFDYVIPDKLPNGIDVTGGLPLQFILTASAGGSSISRTLNALVGEQPTILQVTAPEFATNGGTITVSWRTLNATKISVLAGGLPVFTTLPGAQARVDEGSVMLPSPTVTTDYVLVAANDNDGKAEQFFNVRPVAPPTINTFTLTPSLNAFGDPATARWTTSNATRVIIRLENGATLGVVETPSQVASGSFTFTPANSVRVAIEAYNEANEKVAQVKTVTFTAGVVTVTPTPAIRGTDVTMAWNLAPVVVETVGMPGTAPEVVPASARFIDLAGATNATEITMFDPASGQEEIALPAGFNFPLLGKVRPKLFVSVDGYLTFQRGMLGDNVDLSVTNGAPSLIAPFWDDLSMTASSKILTRLERDARGERFLVVQWEKLQVARDAMSELTFQVQLFETGEVTFIYKTATGALNGATIAVKDTEYPNTLQYSFDSATTQAAPDLELNFYAGGPANGSRTFTATHSQRIEFFGRTTTGVVPASADVRAFGAGDVSITEAMPLPESTVSTTGQWVELRNNAAVALDLDGLRLSSTGSTPDGGYVFDPGTVVPAGGYLLVGQSTTTTDTGGAPVTLAVTDVPLTVPDTVTLSLGAAVIDSLSWDAGTAAQSVQPADRGLSTTGPVTCTRTQTFGSAGAIGTPGAANESCGRYVVTQIPGNFLTAPSSATTIAVDDPDEGLSASIPLNPAFPYFGVPKSSFMLATNGFFAFETLTDSYYSNPSLPSTNAPNAVVAPFWDDLEQDTGKNAWWRLADRTVITWENYTFFVQTTAGTPLNFQVHLLDNGVIEFHYGTMSTTSTSQTTIDRVTGGGATIWLESPSGSEATPWSINQVNGVAPNSGLRFTPVR